MVRLLIVFCVWIGFCAPALGGQRLPVAGEGAHLWAAVAADDGATFTLWHRVAGDVPGMMREVETLSGEVGEIATVARDGTLWLVYRDGSVQSISANPSTVDRQWHYSARRAFRLPAGAKLRSLAAGARGPWTLMVMEAAPAPEVAPEVATEKATGGDKEEPHGNTADGGAVSLVEAVAPDTGEKLPGALPGGGIGCFS